MLYRSSHAPNRDTENYVTIVLFRGHVFRPSRLGAARIASATRQIVCDHRGRPTIAELGKSAPRRYVAAGRDRSAHPVPGRTGVASYD